MKKSIGLSVVALLLCFTHVAYAANSAPTVVSVSPYCGSFPYSNVMYPPASAVATFTATYSDPDGWQNIKQVYMLINKTTSPKNAVYVRYDRDTNKLYIRDWYNLAWVGGGRPGPAADGGAQWYDTNGCTFYRLKTTVSGSGNNLTVKWVIRFKSPMSGTRNIYLSAVDMAGSSVALTQKGMQVIGTNSAPQAGTVTPSTGTSLPNNAVNFVTTYTDANGYQDIQDARILVNNTASAVNCFEGYYDTFNNKLYLMNDAGTAFTGGCAPGSVNTIQNSYVSLNCAKTTVAKSGTTLTLNWNASFKSSFSSSQQKNIYLYAADGSKVTSGWVQKGTWLIPAGAFPIVSSLNPNSGIPGETITITGSSFGATQGTSTVRFSSSKIASVTSWSDTSIRCIIPTGSVTGPVTVTTANGASTGIAFTIESPLSILTGSFPDIIKDISYSEYLNASGGTTPYAWSVASGSLPAGLSLSSSTGLVSGSVAAVGLSSFTIKVTDGHLRTLSKAFSVNVIPCPPKTDEELLDEVEAKAALYFYNEALANGFVKDGEFKTYSSLGATGFGLGALCVMAERYGTTSNWTVTPAQAQARALKILNNCLQYQIWSSGDTINNYGISGFLYHFANADGTRFEGSEISTADMAIFLAGAATAGEYFGGDVKSFADSINYQMKWSKFYLGSPKQFSHGMTPEQGVFSATWDRPSDEALLVSLMALTTDVNNQNYLESMFSWPRVTSEYKGYEVVNSYFGSLFTYVFGHCFFDFAYMRADNPSVINSSATSVNWWDNSVNASYANRQFCIDNAYAYSSYGADSWGITACEFPMGGYAGTLGAAPCEASGGVPFHNGTIAPSGAISCLSFMRASATETLGDNPAFKALKYFYQTHYARLWGQYGPKDSFDANGNFNTHYYGINLCPEVLMIENYRSGLIWHKFMQNSRVAAVVGKLFTPEVN